MNEQKPIDPVAAAPYVTSPGPWVVRDHIGLEGCPHPRIYSPENDECRPLAEVYDRSGLSVGYGGSVHEIRANARLMSAAPELLSALEVAAAAIDDCLNYRSHLHHKALAAARAAIAKAKGA